MKNLTKAEAKYRVEYTIFGTRQAEEFNTFVEAREIYLKASQRSDEAVLYMVDGDEKIQIKKSRKSSVLK